ncbi:flagellar hook-length control protein FliK, partial [bacterium]|nr:flagellar hook-length control protein FliK [bacterium]
EEVNVDNKEEVKSTSSLLDRLIIEAKKDVKTVSEEELKNLNLKTDVSVVVSKVVDEVVLTQTPNEEVEVNKTIIVSTQSTEPVSILTNTTLADETKNSSLPTNVDIKLNVLNETVSSTPMDTKISLMDQLIQKNIENSKTINSSDKIDFLQKETLSKDFISSIYLGSQKNSINNQELFNKNEAINLLKDASSLNDVKTSAGMLDLGLENIDVDVEQSLDLTTKLDLNKKIDLDLATRRNIIDNLILSKNIKSEGIKGLITKSVEASSALLDNTLQLADDAIVTVNSPLSYNIQSKIIGARQQMSTMMSDIAKQMYENYKPPVTVFKINLNPLELGSIAILMKSDKNNALSISMNVSSNSTLDALVENQNVLRNSLNKTFDENTKFNLDFSSSNQNNNQSNNQNNQGNQNKFDQQMDTQSVLQLKEENKDREEKSIDYM